MNTNKHLDDLFAAARHEEPIISEENARELLAKSEHMQASPFIFSTKGIIMSTIGLSLAAFIGYLTLSGSPQTPVSKINPTPASNLLAQSTAKIVEEPKKSDITTNETDVNDEVLSTPPTPPLPPIPPLPPLPAKISTPVKVTGIKPIPLAPEKYAKMGITRRVDGTVDFTQKNENGKAFSMGFPKDTWGIFIGEDKPDIKINIPDFAPVIVTDTKGNRRLMQFSSNQDGLKTRTMQINTHASSDDMKNAVSIDKIQVGGKDGDVDKIIIGDPVSHNADEHRQEINIETSVAMTNESDHDERGSSTPHKNEMHVVVNTERTQTDTVVNGKPKKIMLMRINKTIRRDSTHSSAEKRMESSMNEAEIQFAQIEKQMQNLNLDSVVRSATKTIEIAMEKSSAQIEGMNRMIKNYNMDSILQLANEKLHEALKRMENINGDLNTLIPILVREKTTEHFNAQEGITYDDGLIFWYENSENLTKALHDGPSTPAPGSIQFTIDAPLTNENEVPTALSVNKLNSVMTRSLIYPNPAKNSTTVRFSLSEPRTLAFSIHDLLGRRVLEGGIVAETSAGSFEKELNVSELTSGVYLLVITTEKGEQNMQRLVIEK